MTTKDAYIQHLDEARGGLEALLPRVDIHKQIYPGWTLKQLLDHIAGWDDAVIASLRAHMDGLTPGTPAARGINYYNAETVSTRESLDYEHSLREWHASRKLLKETIRSLAEEKLTQPLTLPWGHAGTISQVVEIFAHHEKEHTADILRWLEDPDRPIPDSQA